MKSTGTVDRMSREGDWPFAALCGACGRPFVFEAPRGHAISKRVLCPLCVPSGPYVDPRALAKAIGTVERELSRIRQLVGHVEEREVRKQLSYVIRALKKFRTELLEALDDDVDLNELW